MIEIAATAKTTRKNVFIIGVPRSGTTWAMMLIAQHPAVVAIQQNGLLHAVEPLWNWWRSTGGFGKRIIQTTGPKSQKPSNSNQNDVFIGDLLTEESFRRLSNPLLQNIYDNICQSNNDKIIVLDQTPENMELYELALALNPDSYFLHMIRDPRAVFCSMRAANSGWANNQFPNGPDNVGKFWQSYMDTASEIKKRARHFHEVRYEDLSANGAKELQSILSWMGLDAGLEFTQAAVDRCSLKKLKKASVGPKDFIRKGSTDSWMSDASRSQIACVEFTARNGMHEYNYEPVTAERSSPPLRMTLRNTAKRNATPMLRRLKKFVIGALGPIR